nr:hypothetical protein [Oceanococcus sp. HetDA_MAG_MS8]
MATPDAQENPLARNLHWALTLYTVFVLAQSLAFKFLGSAETVYIFETVLDGWAAQWGAEGLFATGGALSATTIAGLELCAALMLLIGAMHPRLRAVQGLGAVLALVLIVGALGLHLLSPLGVVVRSPEGTGDGGTLFIMACGVALACSVLTWMRREDLGSLLHFGRRRS